MKKVPNFKTEAEEQDFWGKVDSADYVDWSKAKHSSFPNLKPSTKTISIRFPLSMLEELRTLANQQDVPYQSLIKMFLKERLQQERSESKMAPKNVQDVHERVRKERIKVRKKRIQKSRLQHH